VLVEGGSHLSAALLRDDLIDRIYWFRAPGIIGGDGLPVAAPFGIGHLDAMVKFTRDDVVMLGHDDLEIYSRRVG
jgi:diaminohydroxyphosphoribosylaminopyrimidine deaminase/5-amino-6-(5-phosphoribosylamino)uracil reductase